jgi:Flp pilus assembly secretin CpaC
MRTRVLTPLARGMAWATLALLAVPAGAQMDPGDAPEQVDVSVKIIEFQSGKDVETGFSAYFAQRAQMRPYGRVSSGPGAITSADLTFPSSTAAGITVFLDRISAWNYGDIEITLQALVDENRAYILSRPQALIPVGNPTPTNLGTVQKIPYEKTVVVGNTPTQITDFRNTGVDLQLSAPQVYDEDGNWTTRQDSYIQLVVNAEVKEEGQRVTIALDSQLAGGNFAQAQNRLTVPEFVSRSISTTVWVRDGQVLVLGGLYRNTGSRTLRTMPWLNQAEDVALGFAERAVPGNVLGSPVSSTLGNRRTSDSRRELVFMIKADVWYPAFTVFDEHGFDPFMDAEAPKSPVAIVTDIVEALTGVPQAVGEGLSVRQQDQLGRDLGGRSQE